ncbi:hypothetical protein HaLaN_19062 [Haematococcus lacustris]|uniref:Uncharacterized protein n=1 Tax=Haematococcus lacustris TaxID=44745 RepID=A0A699ZSH4_HAELA|nr:hypothetical protein HaLaN_19062 [Haematococcus lacustris]
MGKIGLGRIIAFCRLRCGYRRLRPFEPSRLLRSHRTPPAPMAKPTTGASRQSSLALDSAGKRAKRLLAAAKADLKVKRVQP